MTDMSTKVRKGYKGDASVLQPTMMCGVPLILDRYTLKKKIETSILTEVVKHTNQYVMYNNSVCGLRQLLKNLVKLPRCLYLESLLAKYNVGL